MRFVIGLDMSCEKGKNAIKISIQFVFEIKSNERSGKNKKKNDGFYKMWGMYL